MFLVFFALDSPGQKQAAKTKTKRKCTVRLIKTGNTMDWGLGGAGAYIGVVGGGRPTALPSF
jgi:hypothetical protein